MSPLKTDLYVDRIDLRRYCPNTINMPPKGESPPISPEQTCIDMCPLMTESQIKACKLAMTANAYLPAEEPPVTVPQPVEPQLIPLNDPGENALVLVTGNSRITFDVMATVWSRGLTPAYLLQVDCLGHTVDMAMVFGEFTSPRLARAIEASGLEQKVAHRKMIVPGFSESLVEDFAMLTGWEVEVGPICAAELPLFLGDRWIFAD